MNDHNPIARRVGSVVCGAMLVSAFGGDHAADASGRTISANAATPSDSSGDQLSIVYVSGNSAAEAYVQIGCVGQEVAAQRGGIAFSVQAPDTFDPQQQTAILSAVIANQPDAILISPTDPVAMIEPLRAAADAGIVVVTVGNSLDPRADFVTSAVTGDNEAAGVELADFVAEQVGPEGGVVGMVDYQPGGSAITDARSTGFETGLAKYPEFELATQIIDVNETEAAAAAAALFAAHPDIVAMVGTFDAAQRGVGTVIAERNAADQTVNVAFDALEESLDLIDSGVFDAVAAESFHDQGEAAMQQAIAALSGEDVEAQVAVPSVLFTADNVDDPTLDVHRLSPEC